MLYKIFEFKRKVGITTKSKETRSQLEPFMQLYHAQSVLAIVSSNAYSQMHVQIKQIIVKVVFLRSKNNPCGIESVSAGF